MTSLMAVRLLTARTEWGGANLGTVAVVSPHERKQFSGGPDRGLTRGPSV